MNSDERQVIELLQTIASRLADSKTNNSERWPVLKGISCSLKLLLKGDDSAAMSEAECALNYLNEIESAKKPRKSMRKI